MLALRESRTHEVAVLSHWLTRGVEVLPRRCKCHSPLETPFSHVHVSASWRRKASAGSFFREDGFASLLSLKAKQRKKMAAASAQSPASSAPLVVFNFSNGESVDPNGRSLRKCVELLRQMGCSCRVSRQPLQEAKLEKATLLVLGNPQEKFTAAQVEILRAFVEGAPFPARTAAAAAVSRVENSVGETAAVETAEESSSSTGVAVKRGLLVLGAAGGESKSGSNINFFLEEFGLSLASDSVVSAAPPPDSLSSLALSADASVCALHPRCALLRNCLVGEKLRVACKGVASAPPSEKRDCSSFEATSASPSPGGFASWTSSGEEEDAFALLYAEGASVLVQKPAFPLLCSSAACSPARRPLVAVAETKAGGVLAVGGSASLLSDPWLSACRGNAAFLRVLFEALLLRRPLSSLKPSEAEVASAVSSLRAAGDVSFTASLLQPCLEAPAPLPTDLRGLHVPQTKAALRTACWLPQVLRLRSALGLGPPQPLRCLSPELLLPLPNPLPALLPPPLPSPPAPALPLVDVDAEVELAFAREAPVLLRRLREAAARAAAEAEAATSSGDEEKRRLALLRFLQTGADLLNVRPEEKAQKQHRGESGKTEEAESQDEEEERSRALLEALLRELSPEEKKASANVVDGDT